MRKFYMLDGRDVWWKAAFEAGTAFGYECSRAMGAAGPGVGFVRPDAKPAELRRHQAAYHAMKDAGLLMVQDDAQIDLYEDKTGQFRAWGGWMPETWRFGNRTEAARFAETCALPIVSKADVGASSVNVRVLTTRREVVRHVRHLFGPGVLVRHCSGGATSRQRGYALFQRFIPHTVTWRVNVIGHGRAVFRRFNYRNRPVAQTGNVEGVMALTDEVESLLTFADAFVAETGTRWCALDVLWDEEAGEWRLLETSLAWPWNATDHYGVPIFRTPETWGQLWTCMFRELEEGAWGALPSASTS